MNQNTDSSGFDQIQSLHYPFIHHPSQEINEEVFQAKGNLMKSIQTFLEKFNCISFGEKPKEVKHTVEQPTKRGTRISESSQNFRVIHKKSSISLNNSSQISLVNAITPVLPTEEPEYSLSMGYAHLSTTLETKSDEVIKSSVKNLVPILSEYEVTSDNESECDVPVYEDSFDDLEDHYEILSNSNNDDISSDDDAFEDTEYVEASLLDSKLVSLEEENDVYQEEKEFDLEDILQIQDVILREKLLSINRLIADIEFLNDNPTPDCVLKSSVSFLIFEKSDNSLSYSDNSLPEFETFNDHMKETSSDNSIPPGIENFGYDSKGDIHFLEELLVNDSISLPENELSYFDHHDDLSFPCPPSEPPDVEFFFDFEPNSEEVISDELIEDECFDPRGEINVFENVEDDDYFPIIFVIRIFLPYLIYLEVFPILFSAGSTNLVKITKIWPNSDKIEHEMVKNAQKPDPKTILCTSQKLKNLVKANFN
nr:hypothetical protein [Tanacetum cinerariifolium]